MTTFKKITPYFAIIFSIFIGLIILIWLDHETKSWSDVFSRNIIIALVVYGLPALLVVSLVYNKLRKLLNIGVSLAVAIIAGIPPTFILVILFLSLAKSIGWM